MEFGEVCWLMLTSWKSVIYSSCIFISFCLAYNNGNHLAEFNLALLSCLEFYANVHCEHSLIDFASVEQLIPFSYKNSFDSNYKYLRHCPLSFSLFILWISILPCCKADMEKHCILLACPLDVLERVRHFHICVHLLCTKTWKIAFCSLGVGNV